MSTTTQPIATTAPLYRKPARRLTSSERIKIQSWMLAMWLRSGGVVYEDAPEAIKETEER